MQQEFEMSESQLAELLAACKDVRYMVFRGIGPRSAQEHANEAWRKLGEQMGFDSMTVMSSAKGITFFTATSTKVMA